MLPPRGAGARQRGEAAIQDIDHRPPLRISADTWAREPEPERLVEAANAMGLRLVVVARDGSTWEPPVDPAAW